MLMWINVENILVTTEKVASYVPKANTSLVSFNTENK